MALSAPPSNSLLLSYSKLSQQTWLSKVNSVRPTTVLLRKYCSTGVSILNQKKKTTQTAHATTSATVLPLPEKKDKLISHGRTAIKQSEMGRIKLLGRTWNWLDLSNVVMIGIPHVLTLFAPFTFNWAAFCVMVVLATFTGFGLTFSYHRNLSHRSFQVPKWLEYFFAYCAVHALEKDPIFWVSAHRYHHMYSDTERDPHSPINGFWFSHMGWFFDSQTFAKKCGEPKAGEYSNVGDLKKQPYYMFLRHTYFAHPIALAILLYALGGFPFLVWGMGVRAVWIYQSTFVSTSIFHMWGKQDWNTNDLSKNNWFLAITNLGEGWHNNHHAFPYSARVGLEWWQIDATWYLIRFFESVGLATNVKLPMEKDKQRMAFSAQQTNVKLPTDQSEKPNMGFSTREPIHIMVPSTA